MTGIVNSTGARSGIIGTTVGSPASDIVASGSNANGKYIKFSSGQLIQWYRHTSPSASEGTGIGGWANSGTVTFTLPLDAYDSDPVATASCQPHGQNCQADLEGVLSSSSEIQLRIYSAGSTSVAGTLSYMAIGTWT